MRLRKTPGTVWDWHGKNYMNRGGERGLLRRIAEVEGTEGEVDRWDGVRVGGLRRGKNKRVFNYSKGVACIMFLEQKGAIAVG